MTWQNACTMFKADDGNINVLAFVISIIEYKFDKVRASPLRPRPRCPAQLSSARATRGTR